MRILMAAIFVLWSVLPVLAQRRMPPAAPQPRITAGEPEPEEAPAAEETPYYLIAFKDHTIYAAEAYYVHGDTLHYLTTTGAHNQASLTLVDRALTARLNHGRGVDLRLP